MKKRSWNRFYKGSLRQYEWNVAPFFDGTICREADLRRVNVFTNEDAKRQEELLDGLSSNSNCTEEETQQTVNTLYELDVKQGVKEWETLLYDGQLKVKIQMGWLFPGCSEYHEILELEGDEGLISQVLPLIARGSEKIEEVKTLEHEAKEMCLRAMTWQ